MSFWHDVWLIDQPLSELAIMVILDALQLSIAHFWNGQGWKWKLLHDLLPDTVLLRIEAILLSSDNMVVDRFTWKYTSCGGFSVKFAYQLTLEGMGSQPNALWRILWRLHVPQRVRVFAWFVINGSLMTNQEHLMRRFTSHSSFSRCGHACEIDLHVLQDYHFARSVWTFAWNWLLL